MDNTKLLVLTAYIWPQSKDHMQMWIEQMKKTFDHAIKNKFYGIIFLGDCNAQHWFWEDSKYNSHGQILYDNLYHLVTILNDGQPSFFSQNGNSVIDLCFLQGRISKPNNISLSTDGETELWNYSVVLL